MWFKPNKSKGKMWSKSLLLLCGPNSGSDEPTLRSAGGMQVVGKF